MSLDIPSHRGVEIKLLLYLYGTIYYLLHTLLLTYFNYTTEYCQVSHLVWTRELVIKHKIPALQRDVGGFISWLDVAGQLIGVLVLEQVASIDSHHDLKSSSFVVNNGH